MPCQHRFYDTLRARGFRFTPQRERVLEAMHLTPGLATAEQIQGAVRMSGASVDMATVYRTLDLLQELGFVAVIDKGAGERRYELLTGEPPHAHLVCEVCGGVTPVLPQDLAFMRSLEAVYGFAPSVDRLTIVGKCASCRQQAGSAPSSRVAEP